MILVWAETVSIPGQKPKCSLIKETRLKYEDALMEILSAIREGYSLTHIEDNEFCHALVFLRYIPKSDKIETLGVRGTHEEISAMQKNPTVIRSMFS